MDGTQLKHVSKFKYLGCILDKPGIDVTEYFRKAVSERKAESAIRPG